MQLQQVGLLLLLASASSCASANTAQTVFVRPTNETVVLQQETGLGARTKPRIAFVYNHSSVPVIVTSVTVTSCQNIRQFCGKNTTAIQIAPDQRREVLRIEALDPLAGINYAFSYTWRADSTNIKLIGALAEGGDARATAQDKAIKHQIAVARADTLYHDREFNAAGVRALGSKLVALRADPDTIEMHVGETMFSLQFRVLAIGQDGVVLGRVREGLLRQFPANDAVKFFPPDTLRAVARGTASVNIRLSPGVDETHPPPPGVHFTIVVK